ncbi:hypothetical protein swp_0583 [Shewanella piezotolerans WP3]|uniref:Uncharacterized protein n=1 Tax=Shewanella piezotolerans (strain WP3 / JCM 13877) TaxID=225849 RepID=B8CID0_SHEPW|nr:hypothetical protein swp_0583 [Shewanella piezotolerans WP3]
MGEYSSMDAPIIFVANVYCWLLKIVTTLADFTLVNTKISFDVRDMGVKVCSSKPYLQNKSVFFDSDL